AVAKVTDERAPDRPQQIAYREDAERRQDLRYGILPGKEGTTDCSGKISIDRKVVPFEHIADGASHHRLAHATQSHRLPPDSGLEFPGLIPLENTRTVQRSRSDIGTGVLTFFSPGFVQPGLRSRIWLLMDRGSS